MKRKLLFTLVLFFLVSNSCFAIFELIPGFENNSIKQSLISHLNPDNFFIASNNAFYHSLDRGGSYKKVKVFTDEQIKHLFLDPYLADTVLITTNRNVYKYTERLEKIFSIGDEKHINTLHKFKGIIYIGTSDGLYSGREDLLIFNKVKGQIDADIYDIDSDQKNLFLATSKGLYSLDEELNAKRLFVVRESEDDQATLRLNVIKLDRFNYARLWLGTNRGLFTSADSGKTFKKNYTGSINNLEINCISQNILENEVVYLGTTKGFYRFDYQADRVKQFFEGLYSDRIFWVEFDKKGKVYLSTDKGLFSNQLFYKNTNSGLVQNLIANEPKISDIQQAALRYNEVHPEKIRQWRTALRFRALFPDLNLDYDKTVTYDSGSDVYHIGPRDWGVSFSWNVADLIWDDHQDDIDTRSRLNTQLRLDILDEINRVYFERLRLKKELEGDSIKDEELFKKQLRLQELTAIIDGYTGGYFTKKIEENYNEK